MNIGAQLRFWGFTFLLLLLFLWLFSGIFFPFLFGFALAYILNPGVIYLRRKGVNHTLSVLAVMTALGCGIFLFFLLFTPILTDQTNALLQNLPGYIDRLNTYFEKEYGSFGRDFLSYDAEELQNYILGAIRSSLSAGGAVVSGLVAGGMSLFRWVTFMIVAPVVAFYLLLDWEAMVNKLDSLLPRQHAPTLRAIASDIDKVQSAFIRGQLTVCVIQAVYYIVAFNILGLEYAFILGLTAGVLSFIPYIGASLGFILAFLVALAQFGGDVLQLTLVSSIYAVGQTLEGYIWVPKLVGESVDLHPVWVMFALMAFGSLMGLTGMLIAVPVAASVGILVRFAIRRYKESAYFAGVKPAIIERD